MRNYLKQCGTGDVQCYLVRLGMVSANQSSEFKKKTFRSNRMKASSSDGKGMRKKILIGD